MSGRSCGPSTRPGGTAWSGSCGSAAPLGGAAAKASAGAVAHVAVADVVNIARALEELKQAGVWTVGLAGDAAKRYDEVDLTLPTAVVVGAEGTGLRRLVRERCDWLVSIPMLGHVESLNVSVAAGIAAVRGCPPAPAGRSVTLSQARPGAAGRDGKLGFRVSRGLPVV